MKLLAITSTHLRGTHSLHLQGSPRRVSFMKETVLIYPERAVHATGISSLQKWCCGVGIAMGKQTRENDARMN
jgi:hypothetical protein